MKVAAVIPARLGSRRFPRKVLARETGKFLVQHVYERVAGCPELDRVIIATDSMEVRQACLSFGAEVRLTSPNHVSGTDRVAEVAADLSHDIVVNVQGDEPLVEHADISTLVRLFDLPDERVVMTTLVLARHDPEGFRDPNIVKAVVGRNGNALYFSRSPAPFHEALSQDNCLEKGPGLEGQVEWFQHIGIYAYRRDFLVKLSSLPPSALEKRERLEQLRVLENGFTIRVGLTRSPHLGIDTEEEYRHFIKEYLKGSEQQKLEHQSVEKSR